MPVILTLTAFGMALFGEHGVGMKLTDVLDQAKPLGYEWCLSADDCSQVVPDCKKVGTSSSGWNVMFCSAPPDA